MERCRVAPAREDHDRPLGWDFTSQWGWIMAISTAPFVSVRASWVLGLGVGSGSLLQSWKGSTRLHWRGSGLAVLHYYTRRARAPQSAPSRAGPLIRPRRLSTATSNTSLTSCEPPS